MLNKTIAQVVADVELAISRETECMDAILADNGVKIREDLWDEDEAKMWDASHSSRRYLQSQLSRIESILSSCTQHIFANCL